MNRYIILSLLSICLTLCYSCKKDTHEPKPEPVKYSFRHDGSADVFGPDNQLKASFRIEIVESEEEVELEYAEPEQYFNKVDCMPLPGIGELIELLGRVRYGQDGFDISIPAARKQLGDKDCVVMNRFEQEYEEEELCDALWNALVECL